VEDVPSWFLQLYRTQVAAQPGKYFLDQVSPGHGVTRVEDHAAFVFGGSAEEAKHGDLALFQGREEIVSAITFAVSRASRSTAW